MEPINVLISGTGSMGTAIARAVNKQSDMKLIKLAFTGGDVQEKYWHPLDDWLGPTRTEIALIKPVYFGPAIKDVSTTPNLVAVEFATPGTNNTPLFAEHNIPWVSGTTGVKKEELRGNGVYDVNMAVPLAVIGLGLEALAKDTRFKDCLKGFEGYFPESHQLYKADPSGTREKWFNFLTEMGASLVKVIPERLEPDGHGYHKVVMHSGEHTTKPLELWAAVLEYAADEFNRPFSQFNSAVKTTSNDDARPLNSVLARRQMELGIVNVGPHSDGCTAEQTQGAELANLYLELVGGGARINFYFNAHPKRGTNAGFETMVDGRGIYMPGIMAAVRYVHDQFYVKGNRDMGVQNMMPVVKKAA